MSNYSQTTFFTPKDTLPPTDPNKTIFGAAYDVEFGNISTAIASKPDNTTVASFLNVNVTGNSVPANGIYLPSANTLGFASNTTQWGTLNNLGNWVFNTPTSGTTLTINVPAATFGLIVKGSGIFASVNDTGANNAAIIFNPTNAAGANISYLGGAASTTLNIQTGGSTRIAIDNTNGNITMPAPAAGDNVTATTLTGQYGFVAKSAGGNSTALSAAANGATAGSNSFDFIQSSTSVGQILNRANAALTIGTNAATAISIAATLAITVNAPSAGNNVTATTLTGQYGFVSKTGAGNQTAISIAGNNATAGSNSLDLIQNGSSVATILNRANAALNIGTNAVTILSIAATGNVTINAPASGNGLTVPPGLTNGELINTSAALTTGAGVGAGTITNAPAAGNPTKWIKINDNGTIRAFPAW